MQSWGFFFFGWGFDEHARLLNANAVPSCSLCNGCVQSPELGGDSFPAFIPVEFQISVTTLIYNTALIFSLLKPLGLERLYPPPHSPISAYTIKSSCTKRVKNFGTDLRDGEALSVLLTQLDPTVCAPCHEPLGSEARARHIIRQAKARAVQFLMFRIKIKYSHGFCFVNVNIG